MPDYRLAARRAAQRYGLDPDIFERQISQESGFTPGARSSAGAQGIAQFIPSTAKAYGVNLGDGRVSDDLDGAARYMRDNLKKYGSYARALSAYNSGRPDAYKDPSFANGETHNYVRKILGGKGDAGSKGAEASSARTRTRTVGGVDNSSARRQAIAQYVMGSSKDPLDLALALKPLQDVPGETVTETIPGGGSDASRVAKRADAISQQKLPYKWGGGHQPGGAKPGEPLDCSGAVSKVLGINPRVSGEFQSWGRPGRAPGGKGTTVYSNAKHVLMEINGRFWGTSASNPGGGAGWIPRSQVSAEYLKGFTARHSS